MLINGRNSECLPVLDRGLQYGDGLFETIAFIDDKAPLWERHMSRLQHGCEVLGITPPNTSLLLEEARSLTGQGRRILKIIITRGQQGRGYFPGEGEPTRLLYTRPWPPAADDAPRGICVHLCRTRLATGGMLAGLKTLNRLEQVMAAREAAAAGCGEGVVCDADGFLVEGIMSNLFWSARGELFTPDLQHSGVSGVMREFVLDVASRAGLSVNIVREKADVLEEAEAIFLTNATGLVPVSECNGNQFDIHAVPDEISAAIDNLLRAE
ncbi:MAG: aminodeoxychorismate lyase [Chromatiales bacterium]